MGHGAKRGVVAAASYEARAFGVRSAMPSTTAMRQCAELVFVPPRFEVYRAVSRQIHAIFADYTALIEPLSLDEAYLDVTQDLRGLQTASATAKEIRARILEETGLTASAGVSYNKFLAKLASGQRKPNGQFVITPEMGPDFIASLPVAKFHGVGPVTAAKMQRLGIRTGADLRAKSLAFLQQHFGKSAAWYLGIANGEDDRPVVADRQRKSSGSETTFERDLTTPDEIEAGVEAMAADVWAWCEKTKAFGRTVTVKVKFADFRQVTRSRSFSTVIARHELLRQASVELVRTLLPAPRASDCLASPCRTLIRCRSVPPMSCRCLTLPGRSCRRPRPTGGYELMVRRAGSADLPLHGGRVPKWLGDRMTRLGAVITEAIILEYGRDELLRRLAHPFWFQSFGAVMGMDWHSSGITTSVIGALKRGLTPLSGELGIHVCGGRGRHSRQTPHELAAIGERVGLNGAALAKASRLVAKVDSAPFRIGFDLYLHGFIVTDDGCWVVVQQGMNGDRHQARRYHWLSEELRSFVDEPHAAIARLKHCLDMARATG